MAIYMTLFSAVFILGLVHDNGTHISADSSPNKAIRFLSISFALLAFIYAFRSAEVGRDTGFYERVFYTIGYTSDFLSAPIYALYNKLIYLIFPSYQLVLIIDAMIIHLSVAMFIYRFSDDVVMSTFYYVLSYYYFLSFNLARQSLALSMMLFSILLISQKKLIRGLIFVILAIGIHNTSIVLLPILFFMRNALEKKMFRKLTAIIAILAVFLGPIMNFIVELFIRYFPRYGMYLTSSMQANYGSGSSEGRNIYLTLFNFSILTLYFLLVNVNKYESHTITQKSVVGNESRHLRRESWSIPGSSEKVGEKLKWLHNLMIPCMISVAIGLAFSDNMLIIRIRDYFTVFFCCSIPLLCNNSRINKYLLKATIFLIMLIPFSIQLVENHSDVLPYSFFW
jgi:hypothetical protein